MMWDGWINLMVLSAFIIKRKERINWYYVLLD